MSPLEHARRAKLIEWRITVLTDRYYATEDTLKRASLNIEMGKELNTLTLADARRAYGL